MSVCTGVHAQMPVYVREFQGRGWSKGVDQEIKDDSHGCLGAVNPWDMKY